MEEDNSSLMRLMQQYLDERMPYRLAVDPELSEDDNVRAVQEQLLAVGNGCSEPLARKYVRQTLRAS